MLTESQKRAMANYLAKSKRVTIVFSERETELYEYLKKFDNKAGLIKDLIREEMKKDV